MATSKRGTNGNGSDNDEWEYKCCDSGNKSFDTTVGHIEDIIMEPDFYRIQNDFLEKYYVYFDENEENKLEYMEIFKEYANLIENYIENQLQRRIPGFHMELFLSQMESHKSELDGEIFDILMSLTDFIAFKEMFLDYKLAKDGHTADFSDGMMIITSTENAQKRTNS